MSLQANPFSKVYDGVYSLLFDGEDNELSRLIKVGNRVSYSELNELGRVSIKENVTTADVPELILVDEGGSLNIHANSSSGSYQQNLGLYTSTGDYRYGIIASRINWFMWCNVAKWGTKLGEITWNGNHFVKGLQVIPIQIGESNPERNRNIKGWNIIWRLQLDLRIPNSDLVYTEA